MHELAHNNYQSLKECLELYASIFRSDFTHVIGTSFKP